MHSLLALVLAIIFMLETVYRFNKLPLQEQGRQGFSFMGWLALFLLGLAIYLK